MKNLTKLLCLLLTLTAFSSAALAGDEMPLGYNEQFIQGQLEARSSAQQAEFEQADQSGSQYADFYFGSIQVLQGITSSIGLYASIPDYAQPSSAVLRLSYSASNLILEKYSSLTFYMNGTPFHSIPIGSTAMNGQEVLYIEVPVSLMNSGYNLLEILCYARLTDDEGCSDEYNRANWVKIDSATCLRVYYDSSSAASELSVYPYPFLSLMDPTGESCAVAVSDTADPAELAAAMTIVAGLGSDLSAENNLLTTTIGQCDRKNVIYVGLAENTPDTLLALLDQPVPPTGALVQRVTTNWKEYLLVVSNEAAALTEAAQLLSDPNRVQQLHDSTAHVSVGEAQEYIAASAVSELSLMDLYTFKDVLGHGASFSGPFRQQVTMYLPVSADYTLSSESRFSFNIRYSENLDFDRSLMTVYWGTSVPLYSRKLTLEGSAGETVTFSVPADAIGVAGTHMTIVFDLEIKDLDCTVRNMNTPWAYIAEDSTLYLPHGEKSALSLSSLPAPFQTGNRLNNLLLILPDTLQADELNLAGRMMAMLGAGSDPYGTLQVAYASQFDSEKHGDFNLVALGRAKDNSFLQANNRSLLFQYEDGMTALASNSKLVMSSAFTTQAGVLQVIASPYAADRTLLVATAPEASGIQAITDQISTDEGRWSLSREALVVDGYGHATSYQFTTASAGADAGGAKPTFTKVVVENREPMLMLLIGMGCMVLLLLGAVIVMVRSSRRRKNKE